MVRASETALAWSLEIVGKKFRFTKNFEKKKRMKFDFHVNLRKKFTGRVGLFLDQGLIFMLL